jgi:serine O-acetyltransferase
LLRETLRLDVAADLRRPPSRRDVLVSLCLSRGVQSATLYRLARWARLNGHGLLAKVFTRLNQMIFHVDMSPDAEIGPGLVLRHAHGVVIGGTAVIGREAVLFHGVTIGRRTIRLGGGWEQLPILGDRVTLGAYAVVVGPILIGDDVLVGAGAVVTTDVPSGASVRAPEPRITIRDET